MKNLSLLVKPAAGLCNMRCRYCFYREASKIRENGIMHTDTVDELIRKLRAFAPYHISVAFQGGEPTLAGLDYYKIFVSKMKSVGCPVDYSMQTNGILIDDAWADFLKNNGFLVGVSLDGGRRTNDRYRLDQNGESVFPDVLSAISVLQKNSVDLNILSVIDNENAADIEATWRYFKKHGLRHLQFIPFVDACGGMHLSPENYGSFLKKSFDLWYVDLLSGNYVSVRHIDNYIGILLGRQPENCAMCGICGSYYVLEANGDLYPCDFYCKEEYKLGSVYDDEPFGCSETQRRFTDASTLIHDRCRSCRYYVLCRGGCRRDRVNGLTENKYCSAYFGFFEYAINRMEAAAKTFQNPGLTSPF